MPKSQYRHVAWRGGVSQPWQAAVHGKYLGVFNDEATAAKRVATELGLSSYTRLRRHDPKTLLLKKRPARQHTY
eukprot:2521252-Lingulodinium_polyedra.AAC.1